jgi:hypothetical protein
VVTRGVVRVRRSLRVGELARVQPGGEEALRGGGGGQGEGGALYRRGRGPNRAGDHRD